MKCIPFSVNSWIFGKRTIQQISKRVREIGADGLDISGEPTQVNAKEAKQALNDYGLISFCVNGNYLEENRTLCHFEEKIRKAAIDYVKSIITLAYETGAPNVVVVPNMIPQTTYLKSKEEDWANAVRSLYEIGEFAKTCNITILLEAVNKYEVTLVRSLSDGRKMATETGCSNIKLVADTFHMLTEEAHGGHNAIREAGHEWVKYLHVGDNTREVPGMGCLNWREILLALNDIDFDGAISLEPLPRRMSPQQMIDGLMPPEIFDKELKSGIDYLKYQMQFI